VESVSLSGRPAAGFGVGQLADPLTGTASTTYAAVMTGAAAGLLVHALKGPTWGAIASAAGAALFTKFAIDRAGA
jgi:hypothetical protein